MRVGNNRRSRCRPHFHRDIWALGPSSNGYPGAFPRGLVSRVKDMGWWGEKRLWLFCGSFQDRGGTTVDIKSGKVCLNCHRLENECECTDGPRLGKLEVRPTVVADCQKLPFPDASFDFVFLDPPYSELEARELYDLEYCNIPKVVNEAARVCCDGGLVIMLHRLIPWCGPWENQHKQQLKPVAIIGVYTIAGYTNMRALSVWRKNESLDLFADQVPAAVGGEAL